ncbi:MAG: MFS transporter [Candidatus Neomarinimicrobiota bacterium]|nr:MFS transporter [Candidatus Neomarinimicrobiota bacterium]
MFTRESKIILLLTGASHFSVHVSMLIFPAIMTTLQGEFNVDLDTLGWMYMLSSFMFGLGALPAGMFEQKVGGRRLLLTFQTGAIAGGLLIIFSPDKTVMTVGMMLMGLSASIYHPAGLTIISRRIRQTSKGMGYHGIAGSLGLASGPLLGAWFATTLDWRYAYGSMILLWIVLAVATALLIPPSHGMEDAEGTPAPAATRRKPLFAYYMIAALIGLTFTGFTTYMPIYFSENLGTLFSAPNGVIAGGLATTLVLMAGMPGQFIGGKWGDRYLKTRLLFVICLLHIPLLLVFRLGSGETALLSGILLGFFHFMYQPIGNAMIAEYTSSASRGIGYGFSFFLSFGVGSIASGIGGVIAVHYGVSAVFLSIALVMAASAAVSLYLHRIAQ